MAHVGSLLNAKRVRYKLVSISLSKSSSEVAPLAIFLSITLMASDMLGINGVPSQDPTAISALKVWEDMLCCMKLTSRRPFENARSASVEAAVSQTDEYCL
jgi:hypothetical protein